MSLKRTWLCCAVIMLLAGPGIAAAQSDVFMCVDGVTGSSTDDQFAGCSEILGVSYSVGIEDGEPPGGGGGASPRPTCGSYVVSKAVDTSSIPILIRSLVGRRTPEVEFAIRKQGPEPLVFLQLILRDVFVVEVEQNLAAGADSPVEKIVLQAREVTWRFIPQDSTGAPGDPGEDGFDCVRNERL
ncbi:MAG: Hcp family type VI secretion system effector [Geminicoccaceae bacterium]